MSMDLRRRRRRSAMSVLLVPGLIIVAAGVLTGGVMLTLTGLTMMAFSLVPT